jgi:hypothetical protein
MSEKRQESPGVVGIVNAIKTVVQQCLTKIHRTCEERRIENPLVLGSSEVWLATVDARTGQRRPASMSATVAVASGPQAFLRATEPAASKSSMRRFKSPEETWL